MGVDVFDIVALILGVWFTVRKLDAQGRSPADFSHVPKDQFLAWQKAEVSAYQFGILGCFAKVLVDLVFTRTLAPTLPFALTRTIGATIDLSWIGILILTFVRTHRTRMVRQRLGIVLGGGLVASARDEDQPEEDDLDGAEAQHGESDREGAGASRAESSRAESSRAESSRAESDPAPPR